jgi:hypothetical protein
MKPNKWEKGWHYVPDSAEGEPCGVCHAPASHKVEELISVFDKPGQIVRHPLTTYLCCEHFSWLMGSMAKEICDSAK